MRAFVFTDEALEGRAGQFVWLSIDTEKADNAPFLARFPVPALPSFYVIHPRTEKVALRWVGGATVAQMGKILEDGRRAVIGRERGVARTLARADRYYGQGKNARAVQAYQEALSQAPADWPHYARATESLLFALLSVDDSKTCAEVARSAFPRLARTPSAASVAGTGLSCALSVPKPVASSGELVSALAADARRVVAAPPPGSAGDDVSSVYGSLADEREAAGDAEGHGRVLSEWASYLEGQASAAATPEARAVFDSHRLFVYTALNEPQRAIPMLESSEKALPDDYNPPARLAVAYKAMKRWDDALAASDRALAKVYGPRKISVLSARADILTGKGDPEAARKALEEALRHAESLPKGQRSKTTIAALKKKLQPG